jgi:hypothetical protein
MVGKYASLYPRTASMTGFLPELNTSADRRGSVLSAN